jgi:hypothetical protein
MHWNTDSPVQFLYIPMLYEYIQVQTKDILICTGIYTYIHRFKPSTYRRWTTAELTKVIAMLQHPDFDSKDIDPDLHQRMAKVLMMVALSVSTRVLLMEIRISTSYWYIPVHTSYILVHTWSVLSMYKDIPRMMLLCCSCTG